MTSKPPAWRVSSSLVLMCALAVSPAAADVLPSHPFTMFGGRLVVGGLASVSVGSHDPGYFNYTDYEHDTLRLLRLAMRAAFSLGDRVSLLGELRTENWDTFQPYALYLRVRPWRGRAIDIQAGRIPPVFGAFSRRPYASDNFLIGLPLAYQYLTSLRADALPASADDLIRMRGRGWLSRFPIGSHAAAHGLPLVAAFRWDTGVEVRLGDDPVSLGAAVTTGTLSDPRVRDNNHGKQVSARLEVRPVVGLVLGVSAARGPFVARAASSALPPGVSARGLDQQAFGADAEYSRGYWLVRSEVLISRWRVPAVAPPLVTAPLDATSVFAEGRYRIRPGLYVAGRVDHLGFSDVTGTAGRESWDAPVTRVEVGGGYSVRRNVLVKVAFQHDSRDTRRYDAAAIVAAELSFWF